jgi:hypothetical protein
MSQAKPIPLVQKSGDARHPSSVRIARALDRVEREPRPPRTARGTPRGKQRHESPELNVWQPPEVLAAEEAEWAAAIRRAKLSGNRIAWQLDQPGGDASSRVQGSRRLPTNPPGVEPSRTPALAARPAVRPPPPPVGAPSPPVGAPSPQVDVDREAPYHEYEMLGLGPDKKKPSRLSPSRLVVTTYRLIGFVILTLVVAILVAYIGTSIFYFANKSWVQPMIVSPTDERVMQLNARLAEQATLRDKLAAELSHTERFIAVQEAFQEDYRRAVESDLAERKASLQRLRTLAGSYAGARRQIHRSNRAYADMSREKMDEELAAGLIDRDHYLSGNHRLTQLEHSNLSLTERQAEFDARAATLAAEARALDAALSRSAEASNLSYEVLRIKQDYELSLLETQRARETRAALEASIERYEGILESIAQSPYLRAAEQRATVAFVPYDNLAKMTPGTELYACAVEMIRCRRVGTIEEILPGEVTYKHPQREKQLRGQLLQIDLHDAEAAEKNVLFARRPPLLL